MPAISAAPTTVDPNRSQTLERIDKGHAVNSTPGSSRRCRCPPVAGQSLHPHARKHQVNLEWRGGDRRSPVAPKHFRSVQFPFPNSRRHLNSAPCSSARQTTAVEPMDNTPTLRVTVISRSVKAVNYQHPGRANKVDFAGTQTLRSTPCLELS